MSPKLNPNCCRFATRCRKLYFCFVGCRKPKKVGNHCSNVSSKMLFILQVVRELTLPLLTDTEITCTGVDIKI